MARCVLSEAVVSNVQTRTAATTSGLEAERVAASKRRNPVLLSLLKDSLARSSIKHLRYELSRSYMIM